jgi:hypothetical protein
MLDGEGAQADGVEELENRRVGSNAQGERKNRHDSETGIQQQQAETVADVLQKVSEHMRYYWDGKPGLRLATLLGYDL